MSIYYMSYDLHLVYIYLQNKHLPAKCTARVVNYLTAKYPLMEPMRAPYLQRFRNSILVYAIRHGSHDPHWGMGFPASKPKFVTPPNYPCYRSKCFWSVLVAFCWHFSEHFSIPTPCILVYQHCHLHQNATKMPPKQKCIVKSFQNDF